MNKRQIGESIFAEIKAYISKEGGSMRQDKFPASFPISRASCYNIRRGKWTAQLLKRLPFKVAVGYQIEIQNQK